MKKGETNYTDCRRTNLSILSEKKLKQILEMSAYFGEFESLPFFFEEHLSHPELKSVQQKNMTLSRMFYK